MAAGPLTKHAHYHPQVHIHLQTARLTLRRFTAADEDNLVNLNSDPEVMRYLTGGQPPSRKQIRDEIIPFHLATYDNHPGFGTWAADDNGTGQFLGWLHLRPRRSDGVIDLGYRLRRSAWGNGYATEGSRALISKGFTEHGIDRVTARTMTVNLASRRVMEKCGLTQIRTYFDDEQPAIYGADQGYVEYQLTRTEWEATNRLHIT
jgi:RimJ/RimL family protein N-acetyltransferase